MKAIRNTMTLLDKVVYGVSWSLASRVVSQLLRIAFLIVLARLLSPGDYGTIEMLVVFTGFAEALADGGLNSALIHNQQVTERHYSTVFWIQLTAGGVLSALFYFVAPLLARFYLEPNLEPLTRLSSCIFLIQACGNVHSTLLVKALQFRAIAIISLIATIISGTVAVGLAYNNYGIWALAWQSLVFAGATTGLLWTQSKWRPHLVFDRQAAVELGRYGIYRLGDLSLNYWLRNLDNLLIGKSLGAHQLGIYARAYNVMLLPLSNVSAVLGQVMFPALAQIQNDIPRFRRSYIRATCMIALVSFPLMTGIAVLSEPLVLGLFGDSWAEVIPVIRVLSFVGLFQSIVHPASWIFLSLGRTKALFQLNLIVAVPFVIAIAIGLRFGILGVASGYVAWALLDGLLALRIAGKYIDLRLSSILMGISRIALMNAIMGIIVFSLDSIVPPMWWSPPIRLLAGVSVGASSYLGLCMLMKDKTFSELSRLVVNRSSSLRKNSPTVRSNGSLSEVIRRG
jgi:PST family polysaccharide transporter